MREVMDGFRMCSPGLREPAVGGRAWVEVCMSCLGGGNKADVVAGQWGQQGDMGEGTEA